MNKGNLTDCLAILQNLERYLYSIKFFGSNLSIDTLIPNTLSSSYSLNFSFSI